MCANTSSNNDDKQACSGNCGRWKDSKSRRESEVGFLGRRPWLFVVFAFVLLFAAWGALFYIAIKNRPASVPLTHTIR